MKEEWKVIPEYTRYQISNLGRVKRVKETNWGKKKILRTYYLKPCMNQRAGWSINLYADDFCVGTKLLVHRLVAQNFLPNPENKPLVMHIDGNRCNPVVTNLQWVSYKERYHILRAKPRFDFPIDVLKYAENH